MEEWVVRARVVVGLEFFWPQMARMRGRSGQAGEGAELIFTGGNGDDYGALGRSTRFIGATD